MHVTSLLSQPRTEWGRQHAKAVRFFFEHSGRRTKDFVRMAQANENTFQQLGTSLLTATVRGEAGPIWVGASFIETYGQDAFLIAVHPLYRRKGIGCTLLSEQLERLGEIRCCAGLNQISFLSLCFRAGLTASSLEKTASGRTLLQLEGKSKNTVRLQAASIKEGETLCRFPS